MFLYTQKKLPKEHIFAIIFPFYLLFLFDRK